MFGILPGYEDSLFIVAKMWGMDYSDFSNPVLYTNLLFADLIVLFKKNNLCVCDYVILCINFLLRVHIKITITALRMIP